ncbi:hypothetical protein OOK27_24945 [Streptomyces canus]|uniref:hypothetical protein n=1 Tax=Streptomyces canus TaxID=58343 RepID=UPI002257906F|nr:hypothetical protein [Streptomyces canus]MCX5257331.1 hypothetical protein [Streptomyces canus]
MLAMAVLLFGVVFTHGLHVESGEGHLVTSAAAPAQEFSEGAFDATGTQVPFPRAAIGERHGGHAPAHQGEHCVSGQPQQGPVLTPPCFAASVSESTAVGSASVRRGQGRPVISAASSAALRLSVVQQV